ncbi:MAG: hypothetical protein KDD31_05965 [Muricauda sp.]|nr:hypothetical protein [Allomuricauda sp.]
MKVAGNLLLILLSLLAVFHVLVILDLFPYGQTWGGSIEDQSQVIIYEGFSIVSTLIFMLIVAIKLNYLKIKKLKKAADIGIWVMGIFFTLSFIGNLTSKGELERTFFIPISIVLVLLTFRLAFFKGK